MLHLYLAQKDLFLKNLNIVFFSNIYIHIVITDIYRFFMSNH